eukprot:1971977-Rhodomonas_salina.1
MRVSSLHSEYAIAIVAYSASECHRQRPCMLAIVLPSVHAVVLVEFGACDCHRRFQSTRSSSRRMDGSRDGGREG